MFGSMQAASGESDRRAAVLRLRELVDKGADWSEALWQVILLCQGEQFYTTGRKNTPKLPFRYRVKTGRNGELTEEIVVDRKENSKSVTRSTVELGFANALAEQTEAGCVRGPKRLKCFGASYLYPMFLSWGLIARDRKDGERQLSLFDGTSE